MRVRPPALGSDLGFGGFVGVLALPGLLALLAIGRPRRQLAGLVALLGALLAVATSLQREAVLGAVIAAVALVVLSASAGRRATRVLAGLLVVGALAFAPRLGLRPPGRQRRLLALRQHHPGQGRNHLGRLPGGHPRPDSQRDRASTHSAPAWRSPERARPSAAAAVAARSTGMPPAPSPSTTTSRWNWPARTDPLDRPDGRADRAGRPRPAADRRRRAAPLPAGDLRRRHRLHDHGLRRANDVEPALRPVLLVRVRDRRLLVRRRPGARAPGSKRRGAVAVTRRDLRSRSASAPATDPRAEPRARQRRRLEPAAQPGGRRRRRRRRGPRVASSLAQPIAITYCAARARAWAPTATRRSQRRLATTYSSSTTTPQLGGTSCRTVAARSSAPAAERALTIVTGAEINDGRGRRAERTGPARLPVAPLPCGRAAAHGGHQRRPVPASLFEQIRFDPSLRYGYDEVDITTQAVATATRSSLLRRRQLHFPFAVGRDYYAALPTPRGSTSP